MGDKLHYNQGKCCEAGKYQSRACTESRPTPWEEQKLDRTTPPTPFRKSITD
ncbi:hypothetical protein NG791_01360 [Laspinema sp. D1]|uniref:hypothetical protein n=1 Tax=Laspinema palackyanum TaxID=3231601 RepID=UPI00347F3445|nr:hypothetical protein [Laspinema sp. D2b]